MEEEETKYKCYSTSRDLLLPFFSQIVGPGEKIMPVSLCTLAEGGCVLTTLTTSETICIHCSELIRQSKIFRTHKRDNR